MVSDSKPRILILVGSLAIGGKERQIIELLHGLNKTGRFEMALAVAHSGGELEDEAIKLADKVIRIHRWPPVGFLFSLIILIRQSRALKVEIVHSFGGVAWDLAGLICARVLGVSYIFGGIRSAPLRLSLAQKVGRWVALACDVVVANSNAGLKAFGLHNFPNARVIHNSISPTQFRQVKSTKRRGPTLCMVANFSRKKDHATLIRALPIIRDAYPDVFLRLVGKDQGTLGTCRRLVEQLGQTGAVRFVTNTFQPEKEIAASDVCILLTHGEGISNSMLEYMAFAKPTVATDVGGNSELIHHGVTGFLVTALSAQAAADRVMDLLRHPRLAQQVGKAARDFVSDDFSQDTR